MASLDDIASRLRERIICLLERHASRPRDRILVALAGVPGSGKTSVCGALLQSLSESGIQSVIVVPMDGFHYSQAALRSFPDPDEAFKRRGAPFTFDSFGLFELVDRLKRMPVMQPGEGSEGEVIIQAPSFDHSKKDPVIDDFEIPASTKVVIVEGNYTLLDMDPWSKIAKLADERWFIDVPVDVARARLIERHIEAGIETSRESAARRVDANDVKNGELIRSKLLQPDVWISK